MKNKRQLEILRIIKTEVIRTQEELCTALRDRGFFVTQATLSRDIKQLRLRKIAKEDGLRYAVEEETGLLSSDTVDRYNSVLKTVLTGAASAMNIAVVKTLSGTAGAAAAAIEAAGEQNIIGTLAGDDTLLVLFATPEEAAAFCEKLNLDYIKG